jgi:hypothetical protein
VRVQTLFGVSITPHAPEDATYYPPVYAATLKDAGRLAMIADLFGPEHTMTPRTIAQMEGVLEAADGKTITVTPGEPELLRLILLTTNAATAERITVEPEQSSDWGSIVEALRHGIQNPEWAWRIDMDRTTTPADYPLGERFVQAFQDAARTGVGVIGSIPEIDNTVTPVTLEHQCIGCTPGLRELIPFNNLTRSCECCGTWCIFDPDALHGGRPSLCPRCDRELSAEHEAAKLERATAS